MSDTVPAAEESFFDICDGANRYQPCPNCRSPWGMGLTSRAKEVFVVCTVCNHEGPHVPELIFDAPPGQVGVALSKQDRGAFDAWNNQTLGQIEETQ